MIVTTRASNYEFWPGMVTAPGSMHSELGPILSQRRGHIWTSNPKIILIKMEEVDVSNFDPNHKENDPCQQEAGIILK